MTDSDRFDDLAGKIGDGQPVDWREVTDSGQVDPALARQLEALGKISDETLRAEDGDFRVRLKDRYRLVDRLGAGGMGEVYAAHREHLGDLVAIKMLPPSFSADQEARARLKKEAQLLAQIKHPNVAQIHDLDEHEGRDFIVMELVHGETLRERLKTQGPLSEKETLELALQMLAGLREAHSNHVIHRDLKPENLIVTPEGNLKILDFGIAKEASYGPTAAQSLNTIAGTAPYMAPEQILGKKVDERTDLYTVGVILAELATGERPYVVDAEHPVVDAILNGDPVPVRTRREELSAGFEACVQRLLEKDPARRYGSTEELTEALRAIHAEQFTETRVVEVPASGSRARSWLLGLALLVIAAAAGKFLWPNGGPVEAVDENAIAVFPFSIRGDESIQYLGEGMVDLLYASLDGAGEFRSIDPNTVMRTVGAQEEPIDPERGRDFARRMGAGLYVLGSIVRVGQELRITATLHDQNGEGQQTALGISTTENDLSSTIDEVATELLRGRVGGEELPPGITSNITAVRAFLAGQRANRLGKWDDAIEDFRRAVAEDSTFAYAYARMSSAAAAQHDYETAVWARSKALELKEFLPAHLLELIELSARWQYEISPEIGDQLREIVSDRPDEQWAWLILSDYQLHVGPLMGQLRAAAAPLFERAFDMSIIQDDFMLQFHRRVLADQRNKIGYGEVLDHLLELSPDGAYSNWVRLEAASLRDDENQYQLAMQGLQRDSDLVILQAGNCMTGAIAELMTNVRAGRAIAAMLMSPERSTAGQIQGALLEGSLDAGEGRIRSALAKLRAARPIELDSALELEAYVALAAYLDLASWGDVNVPSADLQAWKPQPVPDDWNFDTVPMIDPHQGIHGDIRNYLLGLSSAVAGDATAAELYASSLEEEGLTDPTRALAAGIRAQLAFQSQDYEGTIELLQLPPLNFNWILTHMSSFLARTRERFLMAESYRAMGDLENALAWYDVASYQATHDIIYRGPCHLRRGQIYEQLGNEEDALRHYRRLVELWADCDPELQPMVDEARAAIRRLES